MKNPETGKKVSRPVPESEWRRIEVPDLRIIPEVLWCRVQDRLKISADQWHKLGGMTRTERGRAYLFSGLLVCGLCGGSMVICAGGGKRGYVKYGCHNHKHSGVCGNRLMIREDRLAAQLLNAIRDRILNPAMLDYAMERCLES